MAASGAGVLQLRSVEYARNHGVSIHCRSSFEDAPGTVVLGESENMEQPLITAVTHSTSEARITLIGVPDELGVAARIFDALADANVNVDMIVQNEPTSAEGRAEISFTVPREDLRIAKEALTPLSRESFAEMRDARGHGEGLDRRRRDALPSWRRGEGVPRPRGQGINIVMISTSPIKISCVIERDQVADAVRALHSAFELSGEEPSPRTSRSRRAARSRRGAAGCAPLLTPPSRFAAERPGASAIAAQAPRSPPRSARPRGRRRRAAGARPAASAPAPRARRRVEVDERVPAGLDRLDPLGVRAQRHAGHAGEVGLLLHAAGVGEHRARRHAARRTRRSRAAR